MVDGRRGILCYACRDRACQMDIEFRQPNIHGMPDAIYIFLKVPYNFLKNILGLELWSNTLGSNNMENFSQAPLWKLQLPAWLNIGSMREIGIYDFKPSYPIGTLISFLTVFGLLPALLFADLAKSAVRKRILRHEPLWIVVAVGYGATSFLLGTVTGASVDRLLGYGWPFFLIGGPFMLVMYHRYDDRHLVRLLFLSLLVSWSGYFLGSFGLSAGIGAIAVCVLIVFHVRAWREGNQSLQVRAVASHPSPP